MQIEPEEPTLLFDAAIDPVLPFLGKLDLLLVVAGIFFPVRRFVGEKCTSAWLQKLQRSRWNQPEADITVATNLIC